MHFTRFAGIAFIAPFILAGHSQAAPVRIGTYYDETISTTCSSPSVSCAAWFSGLPSDKMVLVQRVNCNFVGSLPLVKAHFGVSVTSGGASQPREIALPLSITNTTAVNGSYFAATDTGAEWLMGQGRFPYVEVFTNQASGTGSFKCTLIGKLVDPNTGP
ncbi:hypothetical protein [Bradyrhizobium sp. CCBAU 53340]|uniref:hypothetical protein n=1 Tax=Bradyrhizobium sp. CCBAU 53340 TaxID=1325112 RepID=UPI00188B3A64|nr:hypothetical protein [Bradyrhizobium sp. CCBAU 53340]